MSKEPKCPLANMVCPRNGDSKNGKYCPAWVEYTETNLTTGEDRVTKECSFAAMPKMMVHVIRASNRPAEAVEKTRNEIANGFNRINRVMSVVPALAHASREGDSEDG